MQSITTINQQINAKNKRIYFSKTNVIKFVVTLLISVMALTTKYRLGIVFILPLAALITTYDRKWGLIVNLILGVLSLIIDYKAALSVIMGLLILFFITDENKQKLNHPIALFLIAFISYGLNIFLEISRLNLFIPIFMLCYIYLFYVIYNKALDIRMYNPKANRPLFLEEITAILALSINLIFGAFLFQFSYFNLGYILTFVIVMFLGLISSPIITLGYTMVVYLILHYTNLSIDGGQILPFIGIVSALLPKNYFKTKSLIYYLISPILFYLSLIQGDILYTLFNLSVATKIYFFSAEYIYTHYKERFLYRNHNDNLYRIYIDDFKEDISKRLLNFSEIFATFANKTVETNQELQKLDDAITEVCEKHCKNCLKKELCLNTNYIKTYNYLSRILKEGKEIFSEEKRRFIELFKMYCLNAYDVINTSVYLNEEYLLNQTNPESLVYQSQLQGLSRILQGYALDLNQNYQHRQEKIIQFKNAIQKLGYQISFLKVGCINKHNINVELGLYANGPINPITVKDVFAQVFKEEVEITQLKSRKDTKKYRIESKRELEIEFGSTYIGKDGKRISGDNFIKCENQEGNLVVALCDGMGSGYAAHIESKTTLELLTKMLDTGADDMLNVSVINTLVSLKEYQERFSTLDYVVINRTLKTVDFYKIGSAPSFIVRGHKVIRIDNDNLPIGFTDQVEKVTVDLEVGDVIVLVSDGVVERMNNLARFESLLTKLDQSSPMQMAHFIIQMMIKEYQGQIHDDMTAIVLKVNKPEVSMQVS